MIKVERVALAAELQTWLVERAARLKQLVETGDEIPEALRHAYRDARLKQHILLETHGKCVYCESKITHLYWGDVEHIKPKSLFPLESLDPANLTLACAICNNGKADYWDEELSILNPYTDDPGDHLLAFGFFVTRRPGCERARVTVSRLGLNRPALLERRKERIELLQSLVDQYVATPEGPLKALLREELCRNAAGDSEYAMVFRAYLKAACELDI